MTNTIYNLPTGTVTTISGSTITTGSSMGDGHHFTFVDVPPPYALPISHQLATSDHVKKITDRLDEIEKRLAILSPNEELEHRWEQLKSLGDQYRQLEQDILEKEKLMRILSK